MSDCDAEMSAKLHLFWFASGVSRSSSCCSLLSNFEEGWANCLDTDSVNAMKRPININTFAVICLHLSEHHHPTLSLFLFQSTYRETRSCIGCTESCFHRSLVHSRQHIAFPFSFSLFWFACLSFPFRRSPWRFSVTRFFALFSLSCFGARTRGGFCNRDAIIAIVGRIQLWGRECRVQCFVKQYTPFHIFLWTRLHIFTVAQNFIAWAIAIMGTVRTFFCSSIWLIFLLPTYASSFTVHGIWHAQCSRLDLFHVDIRQNLVHLFSYLSDIARFVKKLQMFQAKSLHDW